MEEKKPLIIAFEGIDGSGKSTLIHAVQDYLDSEGIASEIVPMVAPCQFRDILLSDHSLDDRQKLLLLTLCAMEATKRIEAALAAGKWVLMDRNELSRRVYQGVQAGLQLENKAATALIGPFPHIDYLIYLRVDPEVAWNRITMRDKLDTFESRGIDYLYEIADGYDRVLEDYAAEMEHRKKSKGLYTEIIDYTPEDPVMDAAMLTADIIDKHKRWKDGND